MSLEEALESYLDVFSKEESLPTSKRKQSAAASQKSKSGFRAKKAKSVGTISMTSALAQCARQSLFANMLDETAIQTFVPALEKSLAQLNALEDKDRTFGLATRQLRKDGKGSFLVNKSGYEWAIGVEMDGREEHMLELMRDLPWVQRVQLDLADIKIVMIKEGYNEEGEKEEEEEEEEEDEDQKRESAREKFELTKIERKTEFDYLAGISDGRLESQRARLKLNPLPNCRKRIVVERTLQKVDAEQMRSLHHSFAGMRNQCAIQVVHTQNVLETVYHVICEVLNLVRKGCCYDPRKALYECGCIHAMDVKSAGYKKLMVQASRAARDSPKDSANSASTLISMLSGRIHGVTVESATAIQDKYPTMVDLIKAYEALPREPKNQKEEVCQTTGKRKTKKQRMPRSLMLEDLRYTPKDRDVSKRIGPVRSREIADKLGVLY